MAKHGLESRDLQPGGGFKEEHHAEASPKQRLELPRLGFRRACQCGHKSFVPVRQPSGGRIGRSTPAAVLRVSVHFCRFISRVVAVLRFWNSARNFPILLESKSDALERYMMWRCEGAICGY